MDKTFAIILGLLIIVGTIFVITLTSPSLIEASVANSQQTTDSHAWTKAICNKDNLCQDYLIECKGSKTLKITPITGSLVKFDASWQDTRAIEDRERMCE